MRNNKAKRTGIPSPTGGLNAIDSLATMPPLDCVFMDNWWPQQDGVMVRKGWEVFGNVPEDTVISPHNIRSIMSYMPPNSANKKLFVGCESGIYDITAGGAIAAVSSAATNGEWQHANVSTAGGNFLWCCNGVDKSRYYNGSAWTVLDTLSTPALTGIVSTDITNVHSFQARLYFTIKNSLDFYYLPVNSVAGAASTYPMGAVFKRGGSLIAIDSWTIDGGSGMGDYLVLITSEGEVAIFNGYDPSNAATWALVGVFNMGKPMSKRCTSKMGGDLAVFTATGVWPLSKILGFADYKQNAAVSYKVQPIFQSYIDVSEGYFGWQLLLFPKAGMLIANVPFKVSDTLNYIYSYQIVMNTTTGAWTRFNNMASEVWGLHDNELYFAAHNVLYKAWTGSKDGTGNIIAKAKQAFNKLGTSQFNKHVKMVQPQIFGSDALDYSVGLDIDFKVDASLSNVPGSNISQYLWDTAKWDQALWSGTAATGEWLTVDHYPGMYFSLNLKVETQAQDITWLNTQYIFEPCGYL